jgi:ATP-dependent DNA helicase RecQ
VAKFWGYSQLRPLQQEAIDAGIEGIDSLVVLPTGGGKSLCYQVPPYVADRTDVVVSPLISLMKDQVDGLRACGYEAAALHSGLSEEERRRVAAKMAAGALNLVFVSPEKLLTPLFMSLLERADVRNFAIDEAHCISQWGHDFRPEYRRLAELRQRFPKASIHAFTATATERVRRDIISQLKLRQPRVLVGRFDRANLTYRVVQRQDLDAQLVETLLRHKGEAAIVYCLSRNDTERIAGLLKAAGFRAAAYHAGMDSRARAATQEAFAKERLDVVVATVAFGMGIDRSNVRCVVHATMPKSLEHYQQETGRAGRDGLEAECVLFYGSGDYRRWESLLSRGAAESEQPAAVTKAQIELVAEMNAYASAQTCRHKALSEHFGQAYEASDCKACDVCLDEAPEVEGGTATARRIVECVAALKLAFGAGYIAEVLTGANLEKIRTRRHDKLPGYGALASLGRQQVYQLVLQLVERGLLHRSSGDMPVVTLTAEGKRLLKGEVEVQLRAVMGETKKAPQREDAWQGVDRGLFEALRVLRRSIADERSVPPFVIFGDATLRELARVKPASLAGLLAVRGVGERKQADFGARFVEAIAAYGREREAPSVHPARATPVPLRPAVAAR